MRLGVPPRQEPPGRDQDITLPLMSKEVTPYMSNVGKARTAEEIQKDWDENPRWAHVERDYTAIADKLAAVGPLVDKLGFTVKNVTYDVAEQSDRLAASNGVMPSGPAEGRPAIDTDVKMAEAILT